jgi:hypothetical protein
LVFRHIRRSFAERRLDAEPHGPDEAGYDQPDDRLEGVALRLLHASAPAPQMLKIRPNIRVSVRSKLSRRKRVTF